MQFEEPNGANCLMKGDGGNILDMPVVKDQYGYTSAWRPSREDIRKILAGAPIMLTILGPSHPPVKVYVGEAAAAPSEASVKRQPLP